MFVGHFGVGFGAKAAAPGASLGTLFLAAQFLDLLWPSLLLAGLEQVRIAPGITRVTPLDFTHYPISHSLAAAAGWGVLFGLLYGALRRDRRAGAIVGAAVVSHWVLDLVVHRPDLPLFPGGAERLGFGLWQSLAGTLAVELPLFLAGVWWYVRSTRSLDRAGTWGLFGLAVLLLAIYGANLAGPPPPSVAAIAWIGQAQWLLVVWGYWIDRHRVALAAHSGRARGWR
jgi:hypothetical protein